MENELNENNEKVELSDDELLREYDRRPASRTDDVIAMQAVLCILTALTLFAANMLYPDIAGALFHKLDMYISDGSRVIPNPIGIIAGYFAEN